MISYKKLISLMEKGDAPSKIIFNGKEFLYTMKDIPKKERLQDIEKYGIWNNGGYCTEENDFLIDEISYVHKGVKDHEIKDIYILPENKKNDENKKDNIINELEERINKAIEYITSEESIEIFRTIESREEWLKINHILLDILKGDKAEMEVERFNNKKNKIIKYIKENILSFNEIDMADIKVILDMLEDK